MSLIFQCSSGILYPPPPPLPRPPLSLCGCCHFEGNYTWPRKHLPISRSLINYCPCRFGSRTEEPNAESRRTSYIKVQLLLIFILFSLQQRASGEVYFRFSPSCLRTASHNETIKSNVFFFSSFKWLLIINTTRVISLLVIRPISFDIIAAREFYFLSQ